MVDARRMGAVATWQLVQHTADFRPDWDAVRECGRACVSSQTWDWPATLGGAPGQHSDGSGGPQTSAPAGAQPATADGTWQPAQA
eukprot:370841-Alexandrium_andersonii.AAC.1